MEYRCTSDLELVMVSAWVPMGVPGLAGVITSEYEKQRVAGVIKDTLVLDMGLQIVYSQVTLIVKFTA